MHARDTITTPALWWGQVRDDDLSATSPQLAVRPRNFLGVSDPSKMYSANGLIGPDGTIDEDRRNILEGWFKKLADRICNLMSDEPATLNLELPSGYTYLLQLVGHDIVDSVPSVAVPGNGARDPAPQARLVIMNARHQPLALDTIFGAGPDEASFAYDKSSSSDPTSPRNRLFLTTCPRPPRPPHPSKYCAFHDIRRIATDPLIADPRNDAHAILAQLTALFHLLHNQIVSLIGEPEERPHSINERLYRRYLCARTVVTLIYRNIIRHDLMGRTLRPDVYDRYKDLRDASQLLDREDGAPLEFSHGAFRFGHALVRSQYTINSDTPQGIEKAVHRTSQRALGEGPLGADWLVDWAHFFLPAAQEPALQPDAGINFAHTIGPQYASMLGDNSVLFPKDQAGGQGLAYRDLRSAAYAGMWSVPALCDELRRHGLQEIVPDYGSWKPQIADWLRREVSDAAVEFPDAAVEAISNDPPLPFFVLYEAAYSARPGEPLGRRLGAVGSILVAESIYGALLRHPIAFESAPTLTQRVKDCCSALLDDPHALSRAPGQTGHNPEMERNLEIKDMPQLLQFMADNGAFAGPPA
jgi:hypothetical protein